MNLENNLFQSRKKVGISQEAVAKKMGVSKQTYGLDYCFLA